MNDEDEVMDTVMDEWNREQLEKVTAKWDEMCPHMQALVLHCEAVGVMFGGCDDCGSPWLTCQHCDESVDDAAEAFGRKVES